MSRASAQNLRDRCLTLADRFPTTHEHKAGGLRLSRGKPDMLAGHLVYQQAC